MMVVMAVMIAAATIFSQMVVATARLREVQRENSIAAEAARVVIEEMRNHPFQQLFYLYNAEPLDDPGGVGTAPGNRFAVQGLNAMKTSPDGLQMEVFLPAYQVEVASNLTGTKWGDREDTIKLSSGGGEVFSGGGGGGSLGGFGGGSLGGSAPPEPAWQLREDYVDEDWGMPRDLSGDSIIDSEDHSDDYILLPVRVRVEWQGSFGPRVYEVQTQLADFRK